MLSDNLEAVLAGGTNFCPNFKPSRPDILSSVQTICSKNRDENEKFIAQTQTVTLLSRLVEGSFAFDMMNFQKMRRVKLKMKQKNFVLLERNKTGKFAVLSLGSFKEKVQSAPSVLFNPCEDNILKIRKGAIDVLRECELETTAKKVTNTKAAASAVKFLVKDHKRQTPLRIVINENGMWQ